MDLYSVETYPKKFLTVWSLAGGLVGCPAPLSQPDVEAVSPRRRRIVICEKNAPIRALYDTLDNSEHIFLVDPRYGLVWL